MVEVIQHVISYGTGPFAHILLPSLYCSLSVWSVDLGQGAESNVKLKEQKLLSFNWFALLKTVFFIFLTVLVEKKVNFGYQEQTCGCYRLRRDSGSCLQLYCSDVEHGYIPRLPSLALEKQGKPRVLDGNHVEELLICGGIFCQIPEWFFSVGKSFLLFMPWLTGSYWGFCWCLTLSCCYFKRSSEGYLRCSSAWQHSLQEGAQHRPSLYARQHR